ncbi:MAG TPA: hypothetical protein VIA18_32375 [Polyangia bacterium]|jgi:hypothetical protein|nr:hypothetical protein [Polyangia bacterium]
MKRVVLLALLAVGCGGNAKTASTDASADLGVGDLGGADFAFVPFDPGDMTLTPDFFIGRYSCDQTIDEYCAGNGCVRQLSDAIKPDAGCFGMGAVAESCGSYVYVTDYFGGTANDVVVTVEYLKVYDVASGQLVAVLFLGPGGKADCMAGPSVFIDPELLACPGAPTDPNNPSDGGGPPIQICPPTAYPPCDGPQPPGTIRSPKCV